jgi:hypothetical protein
MINLEVRINVYELAEVVLEPRLHEKFPALVKRAQDLTKAKSEWKDMPNLESPEAIKVGAAIEAFLKEYKSYCEKCAKDNPTSLAS